MIGSRNRVSGALYALDLWRSGDRAQLRYLREYERTQYLPIEELRALQLERLRAIVDHAYRQCPFYREAFDAAGIVPSDLHSIDDLRAFPILEKRDIQTQRDRMVAADWPRDDLISNCTGGSTGAPLSLFLNRERKWSRWGATMRHNRWAGWDVTDKAAIIWGAPRDLPTGWKAWLRRKVLDRHLLLDTGHVTEERLARFNEELKRFRPRVFLAYAQGAALFARFLKSAGIAAYQPESIVTSAEVLDPDSRAVIEEVFGCRVFNRYGCREVSVVASECEAHDGLHVMAEGLHVDVAPSGRTDGAGDVIVTDLLNRAMPLIRYRIGDVAVPAPESRCACGRELPRLARVEGRVTDFIAGDEGRLVSGAFLSLYLVGKRPRLGQVQIVQETAGEVLYRIAPGPEFGDEDERYLRETSREFLGRGIAVHVERVEAIPREASGKFLFSRSRVAPAFATGR